MKTHPIYKEENLSYRLLIEYLDNIEEYDQLLVDFISLRNVITNTKSDKTAGHYKVLSVIFRDIINNGHVCINVGENDWSYDMTQKTLEQIRLKDLKLAFKSGTIVYGHKDIHFTVLPVEEYKRIFNVEREITSTEIMLVSCLEINPETMASFTYVYVLESDMLLINSTSNINNYSRTPDKETVEKSTEIITILISILIYTSMYRDVKERVKFKSVKVPRTVTNKVPKHKINQINLFQKISNDQEVSREGSSWKSDKRWLVRGHIRKQFYKTTGEYKLIFIDPFWKGVGIEEVEKVYNVQ